jgi:taurine-pyruvate aminotransferase
VFSRCKQRGLIVGKTGDTTAGFNNVITLSPPLIVTEGDLEFMSGAIKEAVNTL